MAAAADVPNKFDVVINGQGYMAADMEGVKAQFGFSPTFVQRQNVQGDFGDNQQDFWLTATQRDWSLGQRQKFFRQSDEDGSRRYWRGQRVDVRTPGEVSTRLALRSLTFPSAPTTTSQPANDVNRVYALGPTNLYDVSATAVTDRGPHGLAGSPGRFAFCAGESFNFFSDGTTVRKWNLGAGFSAFSATGATGLAFLNNTLFGFNGSTGQLVRYDTAGVATTLFTWQDANGTILTGVAPRLIPFGGQLLIYRNTLGGSSGLWIYDGVGVKKAADFPPTFLFGDMAVCNGVVFITGLQRMTPSVTQNAVVYAWVNGNLSLLWYSGDTVAAVRRPAIAPIEGGVAFTDDSVGELLYYDLAVGGVQTMGTYTSAGLNPQMASNGSLLLLIDGSTTAGYSYPDSTTGSATVTTSLFDFDSSLAKYIKSVKVDYVGTAPDIAYQLNDVTGSYTTLQTSAATGTEYALGQNAHSISVQVTLRASTRLKRIYVRAAPVQDQFRKETFVLNCTGRDGSQPIKLRDGTLHIKDGFDMASDLRTAAQSQTPISVTDEFGTFTGVIDMDGFELRRVRRKEYIAVVPIRQV